MLVLLAPVPSASHRPQPCDAVRRPPADLRARPGSLMRENAEADRQRLTRMTDAATVERFVRQGHLVLLPVRTPAYFVAGVPDHLRVTRPWTKRFVEHVTGRFHATFGRPLKVTSLTRTAETQQRLRRTNGNAAPAVGRLRSAHLTGAAVDISKRSLHAHEVRWLRAALGRLNAQRLVSAIEEFVQPHFHVMVFRRYLRAPSRQIGPLLRPPC